MINDTVANCTAEVGVLFVERSSIRVMDTLFQSNVATKGSAVLEYLAGNGQDESVFARVLLIGNQGLNNATVRIRAPLSWQCQGQLASRGAACR